MPLLMMCGYPCSGKSTIIKFLIEYLAQVRPNLQLIVVAEPNLDLRNKLYADSAKERELRGKHKSEIERILTGPKSNLTNLLVIMDACNYIKGYRYELYCLAKSLKHTSAVLYCLTSKESVLQWNAKISRYPNQLLCDLISRFEEPISINRWDSPLIIARPELWSDDSSIDLSSIGSQLLQSILLSESCRVTQNRSTQPSSISPDNSLQRLEQITKTIIDRIMACQASGANFATLPSQLVQNESDKIASPQIKLDLATRQLTLAELVRAKRHFIALQRNNASSTSPSQIANAFIRFLSINYSQ